jgi:hypothetical protein
MKNMKTYLTLFLATLLLFGCLDSFLGEQPTKNETITPTPNITDEIRNVYRVTITSIPSGAEVGVPITIVWQVNSNVEKQIDTAIAYGDKNVAFPSIPSDYGIVTIRQKKTTPATNSEEIIFDAPGTYYVRAHAYIDGRSYWSEEKTIVVKEMPISANETVGVHSYSITIGQLGLSQSEIREAINTPVKLTFISKYNDTVIVKVRGIGDVQIKPKERKSVEFTTAYGSTFFTVIDVNGKIIGEGKVLIIGSGVE